MYFYNYIMIWRCFVKSENSYFGKRYFVEKYFRISFIRFMAYLSKIYI